MTPVLTGNKALRNMFAAVTEQTFQVELGVANPKLIEYVVQMLVRFVKTDTIFRIRDTTGRRLIEVAEMLMEAEQRQANPKREIHRHIGDFTLFWSGVYPEALAHMRSSGRKDELVDYSRQGKESYYIASTFDDEPYSDEAPVLRRLSQDFDLFQFGLNRVRRELDRLPAETLDRTQSAERN